MRQPNIYTYAHTHTHTYTYIYMYNPSLCNKMTWKQQEMREREKLSESGSSGGTGIWIPVWPIPESMLLSTMPYD